MAEKKPIYEMMFLQLHSGRQTPRYPCYLYRDDTEPRLVNDEDEEKKARAEGYDSITAASLSNRYLVNWFWDLEDMSTRQLCVFAKDAYNVDLPIDAGQERLFSAVIELTRYAPQNENRMVLMAHTMKMNYDETLEEIRRMIRNPVGMTEEHESFEVLL